MKFLYIIRHAKSSWDDPLLKDFDRPLNEKGAKSIVIMGNFLKNTSVQFDIVLSSPALRAITTARGICKIIDYNVENILADRSIYHASTFQLLKTINNIKDKYYSAALFGHNPGLTDLYNYLVEDYIGNIPTCGIAKIAFDTDKWKHITQASGKAVFLETPKKQGLETDD